MTQSYDDFLEKLKVLVSKNPHLAITPLNNILSMRLIGNKTHGDLGERANLPVQSSFNYSF